MIHQFTMSAFGCLSNNLSCAQKENGNAPENLVEGTVRVGTVSYTHLDVYKRQVYVDGSELKCFLT